MTLLERTTFTSSELGRGRTGGRPARCEPGPGRAAGAPGAGNRVVPDGPAAGRPRPSGPLVTSAALCPARGGGVLIVLLGWPTLVRGPRTDATGFITARCRIVRARHGVQLFRFRAGAILGPATADRPGRGGEHEHHQRDADDDDRQRAEVGRGH